MRERLKERYEVYRHAHWVAGAEAAGVSPGFASQVDLASLFVERSLKVLRPGGTLSLLLPAKLWRSLAGGGVRQLLATHACLKRLEDVGDSAHAFDAVVYPSVLVASAAAPETATGMALDDSAGAPWLTLDTDARLAFDLLRARGAPLATAFGPPRLGVKSGCNTAFLVRVTSALRGIASVIDATGEAGSIECDRLRPVLRGDSLRPWRAEDPDARIVWTHGERGEPLAQLPPRAHAWLERHRGTLTARTDAARARRWWSLFRVDAADCSKPRVVWADFGRRPRALVLEAGDPTVPLNTCYVVRCTDAIDAWALAAILNSALAAAWLNALAEPARGGYRRYLGWTVGLLPLPRDWPVIREALAGAGSAAASCGRDDALLDTVLAAYDLTRAELAPLLATLK